MRGRGGDGYYCVKNSVICVKICFDYLAVMVAFSSILVVYFLVVLNNFVIDLGWLSYSYGRLFYFVFIYIYESLNGW